MIFQYYYAEYKWLVDFALSAFIFNVIVELISLLFPATFKNDISLTPVWNFLVIFFSLDPLTIQMSLAENLWPSYLGAFKFWIMTVVIYTEFLVKMGQ